MEATKRAASAVEDATPDRLGRPDSRRGTRARTFEDFFTVHYRSACRLARAMGSADPENLAQEAMARLHPRLGRFSDEDAARYLRTTVCNLARSEWRRGVVHRRVHLSLRGDTAAPQVDSDTSTDVLAALHRLPSRQRQVVVLRYWLDLPEAEIAATLNISAGSVKTHAHRGLRALRDHLEEHQ